MPEPRRSGVRQRRIGRARVSARGSAGQEHSRRQQRIPGLVSARACPMAGQSPPRFRESVAVIGSAARTSGAAGSSGRLFWRPTPALS